MGPSAGDLDDAVLRALVEAVPVLIAYVDAALRYRFHNRHYQRVFGWRPGQWVGHRVSEALDAATWRQVEPNLRRALAGETLSYELRVEGPPDGGHVLDVQYVPDVGPDGSIRGVFVVASDVTRLDAAREELRRSQESLARTVQERTAALEAANTRLHEVDQLKSLFLASMSHELRTPLNAIIGFTGLLQQLHEEQGEPDPRALDYLGRLQGSSRQLLALVFDAIDVSKLQAGAIEARPESFALDAVVAETTDLVRAAAEAKGLELRVESTTGAEMVNDRARFAQCLMNLLSNAVKYTEAGGIQVHAAVHGDLAQVAVEDTGIGVADADQARLFQPFVRIDSALRRRTPGSGLGLYLARNLARLVLGGDITMRSRAGAGSMFTLSAQRRMEPAAAQHSLLPANGGTT